MKKKIIIVSLVSILGMIVSFLFIYNSHKKIEKKKLSNFCVLHGKGFIFPFDIEVPKGTSYLEAILKLGTTMSVKEIYKKDGKSWTEVSQDDRIEFDSEIKVKE